MSAVAEQKEVVQGGAFLIEDCTPEEIFTPEDFTEEHRMIAETTRQFVDNEVIPRIDELEKHDWKLARELVKKAADLGLIGANIPEEYGGLGLDQKRRSLVPAGTKNSHTGPRDLHAIRLFRLPFLGRQHGRHRRDQR